MASVVFIDILPVLSLGLSDGVTSSSGTVLAGGDEARSEAGWGDLEAGLSGCSVPWSSGIVGGGVPSLVLIFRETGSE